MLSPKNRFLIPLSAALFLSGLSSGQAFKELEALQPFAGRWTSQERSFDPAGKVTPFTLDGTNRWVLGGQYLEMRETFEVGGKFHENLILMGYDRTQKRYFAHWYTKSSDVPIVFEGVLQGQSLVLTTPPGARGLRVTYTFVEDGKIEGKLEVMREGKWAVATLAEYRRKQKLS